MTQVLGGKVRTLLDAQVVATATATGYPAFPTTVQNFKGDFTGAIIKAFTWSMSVLTTFSAADCTIQTSADGVIWRTLKALTQKTGTDTGVEEGLDEHTDEKASRYLRALIDMTGTPGTSTHTLKVHYKQCGAHGSLWPPQTDKHN